MLLRGDRIASRDERGRPILDDTFLILFNAADNPVTFTLPARFAGDPKGWVAEPPFTGGMDATVEMESDGSVQVPAHMVVVFRAVPERQSAE
jgi:isoamylase